mmetsp:Transcript_46592/g.117155  ORF Transcript_46592/g.117155 Transcript_46592/m.117155 type:complete len:319 (+) Transcript_46592:16-972(+)
MRPRLHSPRCDPMVAASHDRPKWQLPEHEGVVVPSEGLRGSDQALKRLNEGWHLAHPLFQGNAQSLSGTPAEDLALLRDRQRMRRATSHAGHLVLMQVCHVDGTIREEVRLASENILRFRQVALVLDPSKAELAIGPVAPSADAAVGLHLQGNPRIRAIRHHALQLLSRLIGHEHDGHGELLEHGLCQLDQLDIGLPRLLAHDNPLRIELEHGLQPLQEAVFLDCQQRAMGVWVDLWGRPPLLACCDILIEDSPCEVLAALLPILHILWYALWGLRDPHVDKSGDVFFQDGPVLVRHDAERDLLQGEALRCAGGAGLN